LFHFLICGRAFVLVERKFFAWRDILFLVCVILLSGACYIYATRETDGKKFAEVSVNGQVSEVFVLGENRSFSPEGRPAVRIEVRDGAVGFVSSDCPDKTCIHSGFLSLRGQTAACLPNRVVVRVLAEGGKEALDSTTF
jgi:hypothetical protein